MAIDRRLNCRRTASVARFKRKRRRGIKKRVEDRPKNARDGYFFEGTPDRTERLKKRLRRLARRPL